MNSIPLMGKFEGRIGLIPCSVFFYCLGFQIGVDLMNAWLKIVWSLFFHFDGRYITILFEKICLSQVKEAVYGNQRQQKSKKL